MNNVATLNTDIKPQPQELRSTKQFLIPAKKETAVPDKYDIYPTFKVEGAIYAGYNTLAGWIATQNKNIVIDGKNHQPVICQK